MRRRWSKGEHRPNRRPKDSGTRKPLGSTVRRYDASAPYSVSPAIGLPSLTDLRPGWRMVSGALFVLALVALAHLLTAPQYAVYGIELSGANLISETEIFQASRLDEDRILWVDPAAVQEKIKAVSGIESVQVSVDWPARVIVLVTERVPAVAWMQGGQTVWVDAQGIAFERRADLPGLLPIQVDDAASPLVPAGDTPVAPVEAIAGALQLKGLRQNIELLHYDALHGLSYQDGRGWRGYFGNGTNMDVKLRVYETLVDNLLSRQILPAVVSVENVDAPYYRR